MHLRSTGYVQYPWVLIPDNVIYLYHEEHEVLEDISV